MKRKAIFLSVSSVSILALILFFYSFFRIYEDVKVTCLKAQNEYRQDCIGSLVKYIQSDKHTFRTRNSAIWALGQLAEEEALPLLYDLEKSLPEQEKCNYGAYLCKYEVQKAIRWCEKGNITSWMYRNREDWR